MADKEKKILTREQALLRMADLCARSEQCPADIERKLRLKGMPAGHIREVVEELEDRGFIDTARFARSFANDKVRFSGWGRLKIRAALAAKRLSSADISDALCRIDENDYAEALSRVARPKAARLQLENYDDRMKLMRFLVGRGFEPDIAKKEIIEIIREHREDSE